MFYLAVEEHVMQNRQRETVKELELKRHLRDSLESRSGNELRLFAGVGDLPRNLVRIFRVDTNVVTEDEMSLDCVIC